MNVVESEKIYNLINKLYHESDLCDDELIWLIDNIDETAKESLFRLSAQVRNENYGKKVYLRCLIEFTNCCKRECRYCGINAFNRKVNRYRMTKEEIIDTCLRGSLLGFKTFVLQGGEDSFFSDKLICEIIEEIKYKIPDCAITLSIGERDKNSYKSFRAAGADRYLLRHETVNYELYKKLHPLSNLESRIRCLKNLKSVGFQTGAGFMVGLNGYTTKDYASDIRFLKELQPEMIGIGPFIPHKDTELFADKAGDLSTTLLMLAIIRMMLPKVLLPATTALATIDVEGRKKALDVGANVIMPNLTPIKYRGEYSLYDGKKHFGEESAVELDMIRKEIISYGYTCDMSRGDSKMIDEY